MTYGFPVNHKSGGRVKRVLKRHIFLYGPPGSGKSLVGSQLAVRMQCPYVDLDEKIENRVGMSIADFFREHAEPEFRQIEFETLQQACMQEAGAVIALGGGALLRAESQTLALQTGQIVCLMGELDVLWDHIENEPGKRPLLAGDGRLQLETLLNNRAEHYRQFPVIKIDGLNPNQITDAVQITAGRFFVSGMSNGYPVIVRNGSRNQIGEYFQALGLQGPVAVVTDEQVGRLYLDAIKDYLENAGFSARSIVIPAGEQHKNIETVQVIWDQMLAAGLERGSTVLAVGGGVVTDIAGFAAATFLRGVSWVACPTSLLGMVDASLGGKTGVDLSQGKNLVGAFYPPKMVIVDPEMLATLPDVELKNGMAEVLKHGILSNAAIVDLCLEKNWKEDVPAMIPTIMFAKIQVINADPYEKGIRATLNLGHTIGHAIELESRFHIRHGEAIGLGMQAETDIAQKLGLCHTELPDILFIALQNLGLPVKLSPTIDADRIIHAMQNDKKKSGGKIKFALPRKIGNVGYGDQVDEHLVREAILELQKTDS